MKNILKVIIAFVAGQILQILMNVLLDFIGIGKASLLLSAIFGLLIALSMICGSLMITGIDFLKPSGKHFEGGED